ncbi:MAG TPA: galactokinase family protein [Acidobacteriota bacterium]|jgi:L-arabinokinase|nr:galactokinase family protein [Acidobacteriota bacterium]
MYRVIHGTTDNLPDVAAFVETLNGLEHSPVREARRLFDPEAELVVTRAPGRLDVMGGIADYSGSLVLQLPLQQATLVALQRDPSRRLTIISLLEDSSQKLAFEMSLAEWETADGPIDYDIARSRFLSDPARHWAAYVAGVFLVLMRERDIRFLQGARILIASQVPQGKGVSSSASLEVAVMQAVAAAFEVRMEAREMALLCQRAENLVAGAPCGVMDQMTSVCGQANCLLALLCQPAELCGMIVIPDQIAFWGLDSGVRHAVSGADYGSVRVGTFMGYRILADLAGFKVRETSTETVQIDDPRWSGYLANVMPSEFEQTYAAHLPERISGADFLSSYRGTTDPVTRVAPDRSYAVRVPTAHAIYEHNRVRLFIELVDAGVTERRMKLLGELMYQSHSSYSACGLGSARTDRLVQLVRQAGAAQGLYGAKITGGGSGGTVAVLGRRDAAETVMELADKYAQETGYRPYIFSESSPGSAAFGHLKLRNW